MRRAAWGQNSECSDLQRNFERLGPAKVGQNSDHSDPRSLQVDGGGQRTCQDLESRRNQVSDLYPELGRSCYCVPKWKMRRERVCVNSAASELSGRHKCPVDTRVLGKHVL